MERKWDMKNVDLELLSVKLEDFFKERRFQIISEKTSRNYKITVGNSPSFKLLGLVSVVVEGRPDNFSVKLEFQERRRRYSGYGSFLLSLFGGGILLRQEAESDEAWMRIEKEFWPYVENLVLYLANTAKPSSNSES